MTLLASTRDAEVHHCDWRELVQVVVERGGADALIVDAPYSERTHSGHDGATAATNAGSRWVRANGRAESKIRRRDIAYHSWSRADVDEFVQAWSPLVRGWIVSLTDDVLLHHWRAALDSAGRQTFQDVPVVVRGMTVRLSGDGPSSWAIHCAVARPRSRAMASWGTLDGAYVGPCAQPDVVGGKPQWLMERLVEDYSRPGDLIVDPCAGAFTTGKAAVRCGRRFIGGDILAEHAELGRKWCEMPKQRPLFGGAS